MFLRSLNQSISLVTFKSNQKFGLSKKECIKRSLYNSQNCQHADLRPLQSWTVSQIKSWKVNAQPRSVRYTPPARNPDTAISRTTTALLELVGTSATVTPILRMTLSFHCPHHIKSTQFMSWGEKECYVHTSRIRSPGVASRGSNPVGLAPAPKFSTTVLGCLQMCAITLLFEEPGKASKYENSQQHFMLPYHVDQKASTISCLTNLERQNKTTHM